MYLLQLIQPIPTDVLISIQLGAAIAIYLAIVLAATALALTIAFESVVDRSDSRAEPTDPERDQALPRAA